MINLTPKSSSTSIESAQETLGLDQLNPSTVKENTIQSSASSPDSASENYTKILVLHPTLFCSAESVLNPTIIMPINKEHYWRIQYPTDYLKIDQHRDRDFADTAGRLILHCLPATLDVWVDQHAKNRRPQHIPVPIRSDDGDTFRILVDRDLKERCINKLTENRKITKSQAGSITLSRAQELLKTYLSQEVARLATSHAENTSDALD